MAELPGSPASRAVPSPPELSIIGIGCSAGGLEAVEKFLSGVADASGMAFVVVQHLLPDHVSILAELLGNVTPMTVCQVSDGMTVQADTVYVIPPDKDMVLRHGALYLSEPVPAHGFRLPIDLFLRSLAEDRRENAIGIVLSGMGVDGMAGLEAIKEQAGLTLVQDPASAQSDSMPQAAIAAGGADIVARPEDMAPLIVAYLKHPMRSMHGEAEVQGDLDRIVVLLRDHGGNDFSLYKSAALIRRLERRIALNQLAGLADYESYLRDNPQELSLLSRELLIGVTAFFRNPEAWDELGRMVVPAMLARHTGGKPLRAWVSACSTGEEAYSLAILFHEAIAATKSADHITVQIYASDLDPDAIIRARQGRYLGAIAASMSPARLAKFFVEDGDGYCVKKEIRDMVVFSNHDVISDPPFSKVDLISCRNLLIYFQPELQAKMIRLFGYCLNPHGILFLGDSEGIGSFTNLFVPMGVKAHLFQRIDPSASSPPLLVADGIARWREEGGPSLPRFWPEEKQGENLGTLTETLILQTYAPPAVLINASGDLLYVSGNVDAYLEPAAGKVNLNIHAMARGGLRDVLPGLIRRAQQQARAVHDDDIEVTIAGKRQGLTVTVQEIEAPEALRGRLLVVFQSVGKPRSNGKGRKVPTPPTDLARELRETHEELQVLREQMQSSVDELTSSNEELQSSNEELMTSKEEMLSMNEELQAAIAERQVKVDSLTLAQSDMENLHANTEIATIFLNGAMRVRRYTPCASTLFKLMPNDVGRPLSDMVSVMDFPHLIDDAEAVMDTLTVLERDVDAPEGRRYRVRITPYRTLDDVIDGVVITFTDIHRLGASVPTYRH